MEGPIFQVRMVTCLQQPCHLVKHVVGGYFRKKGEWLHRYESNLVAAPLRGHGHRKLYKNYNRCSEPWWKSEAFTARRKQPTSCLGHLDTLAPPPMWIMSNHTRALQNSSCLIEPNLHDINFPAQKQRINDSGSTSSAEAIFEVKTCTACSTRYKHNKTDTRRCKTETTTSPGRSKQPKDTSTANKPFHSFQEDLEKS